MSVVTATSATRPLFRGFHEEACYRDETDANYRGNVLIEALPPLRSRAEFAELTALLPPAPTVRDRTLAAHEREHRLAHIAGFKVPLSQDLALHDRLQELIRVGYVSRDPFAPRAAAVMEERLEAVRERLEATEARRALKATIQNVVRQAVWARPFQLTILGVSGGGKTLGVRTGLAPTPQTIAHQRYRGRTFLATQIPWLVLDCPHDGSARSLCVNFFSALDAVLAGMRERDATRGDAGVDTFTAKFVDKRATAATLLLRIARAAAVVHLGVLVIDEIQVLSEARSGGATQLLNFLLELVNTVGVPVVLVGTYKAYPLLATQLRMARRAQGDGLWEPLPEQERVTVGGREVVQSGADWDLFTEVLWRYQYTRATARRSPELIARLHWESQGIPDLAVRLFALAQRRAIQIGEQTGDEQITPDLITAVAETELRLVRPIVIAIRDQRASPELLARLDDVQLPSLEEMLAVRPLPDVHPARAAGKRPEISTSMREGRAPRPDPATSKPTHAAPSAADRVETPLPQGVSVGGAARTDNTGDASVGGEGTLDAGQTARPPQGGSSERRASGRARADGGTARTRRQARAVDGTLRQLVADGAARGHGVYEVLRVHDLIRSLEDEVLFASPTTGVPDPGSGGGDRG